MPLNAMQKSLLNDAIKLYLNSICSSNIELGCQYAALLAIQSRANLETEAKIALAELGILSDVEGIIEILKHPAPQNVCVGYPYIEQPKNPNYVAYKIEVKQESAASNENQTAPDDNSLEEGPVDEDSLGEGQQAHLDSAARTPANNRIIIEEPRGLLSLSIRNDNTAEPVCKQDVVTYIENLLIQELEGYYKYDMEAIFPEIAEEKIESISMHESVLKHTGKLFDFESLNELYNKAGFEKFNLIMSNKYIAPLIFKTNNISQLTDFTIEEIAAINNSNVSELLLLGYTNLEEIRPLLANSTAIINVATFYNTDLFKNLSLPEIYAIYEQTGLEKFKLINSNIIQSFMNNENITIQEISAADTANILLVSSMKRIVKLLELNCSELLKMNHEKLESIMKLDILCMVNKGFKFENFTALYEACDSKNSFNEKVEIIKKFSSQDSQNLNILNNIFKENIDLFMVVTSLVSCDYSSMFNVNIEKLIELYQDIGDEFASYISSALVNSAEKEDVVASSSSSSDSKKRTLNDITNTAQQGKLKCRKLDFENFNSNSSSVSQSNENDSQDVLFAGFANISEQPSSELLAEISPEEIE